MPIPKSGTNLHIYIDKILLFISTQKPNTKHNFSFFSSDFLFFVHYTYIQMRLFAFTSAFVLFFSLKDIHFIAIRNEFERYDEEGNRQIDEILRNNLFDHINIILLSSDKYHSA